MSVPSESTVSHYLLSFTFTLVIASSIPAALTLSAAPWPGRLQIRDGAFVDARGQPVLPLCAHFGEAFSAWVRRPRDVEEQLAVIKQAGYDCIRFWDNLGEYSEAWRGKEVSPFSWTNGDGLQVVATPGYYEKLRLFLTALGRTGLTAQHSRGDLGRGRPAVPLEAVIAHSHAVAAIYDQVGWHVLALYEGNNEDFQNGSFGAAGLLRIVEPLKARGALVASSCPGACTTDDADVRTYSQGFSVRYFHSPRDGDATDRIRWRFSAGYQAPDGTPSLGWDGEPIGPKHHAGPGVSINSTEDVEEIALLHAMSLIARSATTYMSQHGVYWNGPLQQQAGFFATPRIRDALDQFAPDVMRWSLYHGGRTEAVFRSADGYAGDDGVTQGPARIDQAISPDRRSVVALVYGGRPPARVRNDLGCRAAITVVAPRADEAVQKETVRIAAGASFEVDYRVGRLLLGRCES